MPEPCGNCDNCLQPPETWDATEAAQKALSCVYRTGQRFGAGHVIDVLLGKDTERIRSFRHQRLSTWGIGADLDAKEWRSVFRQLVARGFLSVDIEGYGGLHLTPESRALLRGEQTLALRRDARAPRAARSRDGAGPSPAATVPPGREALFDALRARRRELAERQGVPPYVIFHDASLAEMSARCPRSLHEFAEIPGVGEKKLDRYAAEFLDVIAQHAAG